MTAYSHAMAAVFTDPAPVMEETPAFELLLFEAATGHAVWEYVTGRFWPDEQLVAHLMDVREITDGRTSA